MPLNKEKEKECDAQGNKEIGHLVPRREGQRKRGDKMDTSDTGQTSEGSGQFDMAERVLGGGGERGEALDGCGSVVQMGKGGDNRQKEKQGKSQSYFPKG